MQFRTGPIPAVQKVSKGGFPVTTSRILQRQSSDSQYLLQLFSTSAIISEAEMLSTAANLKSVVSVG